MFGITGATGATIMKYILPGILHLRLDYMKMQTLTPLQKVFVRNVTISFLSFSCEVSCYLTHNKWNRHWDIGSVIHYY